MTASTSEQSLDRSSSHRRIVSSFEKLGTSSVIGSDQYPMFRYFHCRYTSYKARSAAACDRFNRRCQHVIDEAYATNCNRSEESRACRKDNWRIVSLYQVVHLRYRGLWRCGLCPELFLASPVSLLAGPPPKKGTLMRLRDLPSHYNHGRSTKSG